MLIVGVVLMMVMILVMMMTMTTTALMMEKSIIQSAASPTRVLPSIYPHAPAHDHLCGQHDLDHHHHCDLDDDCVIYLQIDYFQDLKNQILTTNLWVETVSFEFC